MLSGTHTHLPFRCRGGWESSFSPCPLAVCGQRCSDMLGCWECCPQVLSCMPPTSPTVLSSHLHPWFTGELHVFTLGSCSRPPCSYSRGSLSAGGVFTGARMVLPFTHTARGGRELSKVPIPLQPSTQRKQTKQLQ